MDVRLLDYYNQELRYLREAGAEFAQAFPKIATRLGMAGLEVADPYVERLLEGVAFLAARVQLKMDAEFPRFSERLLDQLFPNLLAPLPAMLVIEAQPQRAQAALLEAPEVPRGSALRIPVRSGETECEFRLGQALQLTPLTIESIDYLLNVGELGVALERLPARPRCAVRVRMSLPEGQSADELALDELRWFVAGNTDLSVQLHELLMSSCCAVAVTCRDGDAPPQLLAEGALQAVGYTDEEAMLPVDLRGPSGLRLLLEYFAFPERFRFFTVRGLRPALAGLAGRELELLLLCNRPAPGLAGQIDASLLRLHCAPAINLFPLRGDRLAIDDASTEVHIVPRRNAPLDYEVFSVTALSGFDGNGAEHKVAPLFAPEPLGAKRPDIHFSLRREARLESDRVRRAGPRSGYVGGEVFVSLVDVSEQSSSHGLRQLAPQLMCTNRDLPLFIGGSAGAVRGSLESSLPLAGVSVAAGPSRPRTAQREGGAAWRLVNLITLNHLSLLELEPTEAAAALRELLLILPGVQADASLRRQVEALQEVITQAVVRRHPSPGPIAFARGLSIELKVDRNGFEGASPLLFGAALHHYLSGQVTINSFVETALSSLTEPTLMRWQPVLGGRGGL